MKQAIFQKMSSYAAVLAGLSAFAYAYFFVVAKDVRMSSLFLLLLGLFALEVFIALYGKLKSVNEDLARVALVLGLIGATGTAIHGGYDLANAINPPSVINTDLPSQVDPRGLLSFGFTGLSILKFSWIMSNDKFFARWIRMLGYLSGVLLVIIYLARLVVLNPTNPLLLYPVLVGGFIANPLWYVGLGLSFDKKT